MAFSIPTWNFPYFYGKSSLFTPIMKSNWNNLLLRKTIYNLTRFHNFSTAMLIFPFIQYLHPLEFKYYFFSQLYQINYTFAYLILNIILSIVLILLLCVWVYIITNPLCGSPSVFHVPSFRHRSHIVDVCFGLYHYNPLCGSPSVFHVPSFISHS